MTENPPIRGKRTRPLIEPEPDPPVVREVAGTGRTETGKWLPGHKGYSPYSTHTRNINEAMRQALNGAFAPERLLSEYEYHIFVRHSESALFDFIDRVGGKAVQALTVDPGASTMDLLQRLVESQLAGSPTLIEAPISQPEPND